MSVFSQNRVTNVKGISNRRRLPRLAKIRLGFKVVNGNKEFPAESPFFVLPPEIARFYGFKTKEDALKRATEMQVKRKDVLKFVEINYARLSEELEIMLPVNDMGAVFPQAYTWYGSSRGVKCMGDGEHAMRYDDQQRGTVQIPCPCEKLKGENNPRGECTLRGHLQCLVPKAGLGGVYQIDTGSYNSTVDINSGISYVQALMKDAGVATQDEDGQIVGRFAMVPLVIRRIPTETHHDNQKQIHYTIQLLPAPSIDINALNKLRQDTRYIMSHGQVALPPAEDINPAMDTGDVIIEGEIVGEGSEGAGELTEEQEKEALIASIKELRRNLKKEDFENIRKGYKTPAECTIDELRSFESEIKKSIADTKAA